MTMRFAGVALAAMVGACALVGEVERAEAYNISVRAGGPNIYDGADVTEFTFFTDGRKGKGSYNYQYEANDSNFYGYTVLSNKVTGSFTTGKNCTFIGQDNCSTLDVIAVFNDYTLFEPTSPPGTAYYPSGPFEVRVHTEVARDLSGGYYTFGSIVGNESYFSFADVLITVPLPSSLPLLGSALLALGGLGYQRRRGRSAQFTAPMLETPGVLGRL